MAQILVVDDEIGIRELLSEILEDEGHHIWLAENATAARRLRAEKRPDLVLLDVMMPGSLDGYQVCQKIRQEPGLCNIPVILLTARGQQADFEMGRQAGADAYLTKPFSPLELIDTVDSQLARTVGAHA